MNEANMQALLEDARVKLGLRKGSNTIIRVPPLAAAIPAVAGRVTAPLLVPFRQRCVVIAMQGQVSDASDATAATTELRINYGSGSELVTDGNTAAFAPFLALFGRQIVPYLLELPGMPGFPWTVFYKNQDAGKTPLPDLIFGALEY